MVPFRPKYHLGGPEHLGLNPFREVLVKPDSYNPTSQISGFEFMYKSGATGPEVPQSDRKICWLSHIFLGGGHLDGFHIEVVWRI